MHYLYLAPLCLFFSVALVTMQAKKPKRYQLWAILFKSIASLLFLLFGILSYLNIPPEESFARSFGLLLLIGLGFGAFGDIFLEFRSLGKRFDACFYIGAGLFFVGHILYLNAFIPLAGSLWIPCALSAVILTLIVGLSMYSLYPHRPLFFKILSLFYLLAVISVAVFGFGIFVASGVLTAPLTLCLFLGGLFFASSDIILVARMNSNRFGFTGALALILLYYTAQLLIAGSLQLL